MPHFRHPAPPPATAVLVAMTRDRLIGAEGRIPWDIPDDRRLFRELTLGNTVVMGRKTFESIGAPLDGRNNIVLTRNSARFESVRICHSFLDGLAEGMRLGRPVFFIGGEEVYRKALRIADWLHVSWIDGNYRGDRYFPEFDLSCWQPVSLQRFPDFEYIRYRRTAPQI